MKSFIFVALVITTLLGTALSVAGSGSRDPGRSNLIVLEKRWYANPQPPSSGVFRLQTLIANYQYGHEANGPQSCEDRRPNLYAETWPSADGPAADEMTQPMEFVYEARINNSGEKEIEGITWDYVFADSATSAELSRHTFSNVRRLAPGQTRTLIGVSGSPPTLVITVGMLARGDGDTYKERVEIRSITYADGSVWGKLQK
jgi:hypothetical protein